MKRSLWLVLKTLVFLIPFILFRQDRVAASPALGKTEILLQTTTKPFFLYRSSANPTPPTITYEDLDDVINDEPDPSAYINLFNINEEEALIRISLTEKTRDLYAEVQKEESFAGLWIENVPDFKAVIQFTESHTNLLNSYSIDEPLRAVIDVRLVSISLDELKNQQKLLEEILSATELNFAHEIQVKRNLVALFVPVDVDKDDVLRTLGVDQLPQHVEIVATKQQRRQTANIYGGLDLPRLSDPSAHCTSGFSVMHEPTGDLGITTAGHCGNDRVYLGVHIPFRDDEQQPVDIQWHDPATYTPKSIFFNGSTTHLVQTLVHYNSQMIGEPVCKYGITTLYGCGTIDSKTYLGTMVTVGNSPSDLSEPGDSGGPWFHATLVNRIYGIQSSDLEPGNAAIYTPINDTDTLDLCVLRRPSNATLPTFTGILQSGQVKLTWSNPDDICGHALYRSTDPYFSASESTLHDRYPIAVVGHNNSAGVGDPSQNYYYVLRPVLGFNEIETHRIGEFDFSIVPGT